MFFKQCYLIILTSDFPQLAFFPVFSLQHNTTNLGAIVNKAYSTQQEATFGKSCIAVISSEDRTLC